MLLELMANQFFIPILSAEYRRARQIRLVKKFSSDLAPVEVEANWK